jgi:hypothetical protein
LYRMGVACVADVSEEHTASIVRAEVRCVMWVVDACSLLHDVDFKHFYWNTCGDNDDIRMAVSCKLESVNGINFYAVCFFFKGLLLLRHNDPILVAFIPLQTKLWDKLHKDCN